MNKSRPSNQAPPAIAIIGMEGSGKTVLITTLAKRLSTIDHRGIFLNPQGVRTLRYVEEVWQRLQSGDWPPSTPEATVLELRWKLQIVGELECDVRLVDPAGQDIRLLFGDERILDLEQLPEQHRPLADYCRSASIVLFLLNLRDIIGEGDPSRRSANEAALKSAMDCLGNTDHERRVCLVLTQIDLYRELAQQVGGWRELLAKEVPYIYGAHVHGRAVAVHAVAAVSDTTPGQDEQGSPRRFPTPGFQSEGLDQLVDWLVTQVRELTGKQAQHTHSEDGRIDWGVYVFFFFFIVGVIISVFFSSGPLELLSGVFIFGCIGSFLGTVVSESLNGGAK